VVAANWSPPSPTVLESFARTAGRSLAEGRPARYLIGYAGPRPVAAAELFYGAGAAGFYNVCTLETHRRQGWATALLSSGLRLAAEDGYDSAILQAAQAAIGVYAHLGFQPRGDVVEHAFRP
jgi:ribosomal protein S18 acetylase RimI-like enzyme